MTNLKIRFCVDFGELNHFYTHRINSVTLRVKEKSDDTSNQYIVCGLLDSVAKIPKIPISENSGAPNAFWGDKTDSVLTALSLSTFLEKINLTTIKMLEILRENRILFLFDLGIFLSFEK